MNIASWAAPRGGKWATFVESKLHVREAGYNSAWMFWMQIEGAPRTSNISFPVGVTEDSLLFPFGRPNVTGIGPPNNDSFRLVNYNSGGAISFDGETPGNSDLTTAGLKLNLFKRLPGADGSVTWSQRSDKIRVVGTVNAQFKKWHAPIDNTGAAGVSAFYPPADPAGPFWTLDSTENVNIPSNFDYEDRTPATPSSSTQLTCVQFLVV